MADEFDEESSEIGVLESFKGRLASFEYQRKTKMSKYSERFRNFRKKADLFVKMGLARFLEFFAYLGIDLSFEIESLQQDFVNSKSFLKAVEKVFEECDVYKNGSLDTSEFFCAVLLLYHKLRKIPYVGKIQLPPQRRRIYDLFYKYVRLQKKVEEKMSQEEKGMSFIDFFRGQSPTFEKKKQTKTQKILDKIKVLRVKRKEAKKVLFKDVSEKKYYFAAATFALIFHFFSCFFGEMLSFGECFVGELHVFRVIANIFAIFSATFCMIVARNVFNPMQVSKVEAKVERKDSNVRIKQVKRNSKKNRKLSKESLPKIEDEENEEKKWKKRRYNTMVRQEFVLEKIRELDTRMKKETFVYLCQKHFSNYVFSETWRTFMKALLLPIVAWQLKKFLEFLTSFCIIFLQDVIKDGSLFVRLVYFINFINLQEKIQALDAEKVHIPLSVATSVAMACFTLIVEPVAASIMWGKLEKEIKKDMIYEDVPEGMHRKGTGDSARSLEMFLSNGTIRSSGAGEDVKKKKKMESRIKTKKKIKKLVGLENVENVNGAIVKKEL